MRKRLRIGEISNLFKLSKPTLRYYDEIGLFSPKYTDEQNQYRYYGIEQFATLDAIIFLRKNGFAIKDIKEQLEKRSPEGTLDLLQRKLEETRQEIRDLEIISRKIQNKITTIQEGLSLLTETAVTIKEFGARSITYYYNEGPVDMIAKMDEIHLSDMERISQMSHVYDGFFTGDLGFVVDYPSLQEEGPVKYGRIFDLNEDHASPHFLRGGLYACYPYKGPYEDIKEAHLHVLDHIHTHGYLVDGEAIELYILDESVVKDENDYLTMIQVPVKRR
ncbi:MerR family transcriptional regulator [Rossellomorea marisflavi]|uniref:MerR family transcriptional regulator n=1 Tax=Rossellomorea marisflavi TaxID=189381 RepID=UPI00203CF92F|nr:MerR family transcriptional regulator [Rossellomorea marisflavi]MCM2605462.1 MerR family transcriptional regulator [Rossellomorea marisflavi]